MGSSCDGRYSEFFDLREKLVAELPHCKTALPALPPKSIFCKDCDRMISAAKLTEYLIIDRFQPKFLEKRRSGLSYFLT